MLVSEHQGGLALIERAWKNNRFRHFQGQDLISPELTSFLDHAGRMTTHSANTDVTDSAAASTAMATGHKGQAGSKFVANYFLAHWLDEMVNDPRAFQIASIQVSKPCS